jgi:general secretion pathway protein C
VYFVNDGLPGGATLQRVEIDRVVLARNGAFEVLRLPRLGSGQSPAPRGATRPAAAAPATANVQDMVARNAAGFLDVIRPQPFMPDGQLKGYRIYPGPNRDQFTALGLRPGDLVTEINGVTLDNPAQGMEVFRSLGEAAQVSITVERDGQPTVLSLNMNQISTLGGATQ